MGRNQYWAGRVYDLCVYYMTGTPEGSTESGFMEKPGIEHPTPGLQGIALIHYTTGMVDGSVMVTFIPNKVNTFVLLEINCKIISLGGAKITYFVHIYVMERYYI